jgi:hypothetical protein
MAITFSNFGRERHRDSARWPARPGAHRRDPRQHHPLQARDRDDRVRSSVARCGADATSAIALSVALRERGRAAPVSPPLLERAVRLSRRAARSWCRAWRLVAGMAVFLVGALIAFGCGVTRASAYLAMYGLGQVVQTAILDRASRRLGRAGLHGVVARVLPDVSRDAADRHLGARRHLYYYVNTLLLRDLRGEVEVGEFNAAYRIVTLGVMVPMLFTQALFPGAVAIRPVGFAGPSRVMLRRSMFYLLWSARRSARALNPGAAGAGSALPSRSSRTWRRRSGSWAGRWCASSPRARWSPR